MSVGILQVHYNVFVRLGGELHSKNDRNRKSLDSYKGRSLSLLRSGVRSVAPNGEVGREGALTEGSNSVGVGMGGSGCVGAGGGGCVTSALHTGHWQRKSQQPIMILRDIKLTSFFL
jgi:hypothetical protein